jgi:hypothetical protein
VAEAQTRSGRKPCPARPRADPRAAQVTTVNDVVLYDIRTVAPYRAALEADDTVRRATARTRAPAPACGARGVPTLHARSERGRA